MSARSLRRDGHLIHETGRAACPRLLDAETECDGLVRVVIRGEADDINDFNGGTPGWEEVEAQACPSCGFAAWDEEQVEALRGAFQRDEPEPDA